jgi:hypothetical protein
MTSIEKQTSDKTRCVLVYNYSDMALLFAVWRHEHMPKGTAMFQIYDSQDSEEICEATEFHNGASLKAITKRYTRCCSEEDRAEVESTVNHEFMIKFIDIEGDFDINDWLAFDDEYDIGFSNEEMRHKEFRDDNVAEDIWQIIAMD